MEGFRTIIRDEIMAERERAARSKDEEKLLDELIAIATVEPGPRMLDMETDKLYQEQASRLQSQGIDMKTYLSHVAKSEEEYKAEIIAPEAKRRLVAELLLKKLQDDRAATASDEEVAVEVQNILKDYQNPTVRERLIAKLVPGDRHYEDIRTRLAYRKVIDSFFAA